MSIATPEAATPAVNNSVMSPVPVLCQHLTFLHSLYCPISMDKVKPVPRITCSRPKGLLKYRMLVVDFTPLSPV